MPPATAGRTASQLGGQAAYAFVGNVFTLLIGFPLQIYVARMLGASGLGVFSLIDGGVGLAATLMAFGQAPTLVKFIPYHLERGENACIRLLVARGATILLVAGTLAYGFAMLGLPLAIRYWPILAEHRSAIHVMAFLMPLSLFGFFLQQGLRGFQEIRYMVFGSSFLQLTVKAVVAVALLSAGFHLLGYVWAVLLSTACAVAWMAVGLCRKLAEMPSTGGAACSRLVKHEWRDYSRVMYGGSLLGIGGSYLDRFLLGALAGTQSVGVLAVVKQLQQLPAVFLQMFLAVAAPMFSSAHARGSNSELQNIYHLTTDWVIRLSAPLFIFFFVFAHPLLLLFGQRFADEGAYPLRVLLAGQVVNLAFGPIGTLMNMIGLEVRALKLAVYQMILTVMGFCVLIPLFGLAGAAWAFTLGIVLGNAVTFWFVKLSMQLRWSDARYLRWIIPTVASWCVGFALFRLGPADIGIVAMAAYLTALYALFHLLSLAQGIGDDDRALFEHLRARLGFRHDASR